MSVFFMMLLFPVVMIQETVDMSVLLIRDHCVQRDVMYAVHDIPVRLQVFQLLKYGKIASTRKTGGSGCGL